MIDWDCLHGAVADAFGEPATYQSAASGTAYAVNLVFDEAYKPVDPTGGYAVQSTQPLAGLQVSQIAPDVAQQGDVATILRTGEVFTVREPNPDGHGWCLLHLNYTGL